MKVSLCQRQLKIILIFICNTVDHSSHMFSLKALREIGRQKFTSYGAKPVQEKPHLSIHSPIVNQSLVIQEEDGLMDTQVKALSCSTISEVKNQDSNSISSLGCSIDTQCKCQLKAGMSIGARVLCTLRRILNPCLGIQEIIMRPQKEE